ncbi:MAG: class I SAM-dependent methyltransferase, partial [Candidatus Pacebacteria bacterium]|nr:class I SAM-dependent methyltransferase [Candidatus Paceibacterota bacterium]
MEANLAKIIWEKTIKDYDKIADKYAEVREKGWREMEFLFKDFIKPDDFVLDLGCGNGRFYEAFRDNKADYIGTDPSEKLIEIAKKNYPEADFQVADAFSLPFDNNYFDGAYSIAVLHHIPSEELRLKFLAEAARVLKRDGYLILTVWDLNEKRKQRRFNLLAKLWEMDMDKGDMLLPWYGVRDEYFHAFDLPELVNLAQKADLRVVEKG